MAHFSSAHTRQRPCFSSYSSTARCLLLCITVLLLVGLTGCPKRQALPAPLPDVRIGVTKFTQPVIIAELMAGYLPDKQGIADEQMLAALDRAFLDSLAKQTQRGVVYAPLIAKPDTTQRSGRATALDYWVAVGQAANVDLLLVPQVIHIRERQGGQAGVSTSAEILMDIFLVDVRGATLAARSNYEEKQVGLTDNLLTLPKFIERGGAWVTALELAQEGMDKAIREFGL